MVNGYKTIHNGLSGWHYLEGQPVTEKEVEGPVKRGLVSGIPFYFMLITSSVIAILGVLSNSAVVIIGAMIIAPLMNLTVPISNEVILVKANAIEPPGWIIKSFINVTRIRLTEVVGKPVVLEVGIYFMSVIRSKDDLPDLKRKEGFPCPGMF